MEDIIGHHKSLKPNQDCIIALNIEHVTRLYNVLRN